MKAKFSNLYIKNLYDFNDNIIIKNANNVVDFVKNNLNIQEETQEILYCLCLNTKANVVNIFENSKGTSNFSTISPKDILKRVLLSNADSVILIHNHPSGNPTPSKQDNFITETIKKGCQLLDINFLDHIIIGKAYYSYMESKAL